MAKRKKKRKIRAITYTDKVYKTKFVQDKKTGKMRGRATVSGYGDRTAVRRVKSGSRAGQIFGRTKSIKVKGSGKSRGHSRRL